MNTKTKLLWVEDQAKKGALLNCSQMIEKQEEIELKVISFATIAEEEILSTKYDKILFDIRILPGIGDFWENEHNALNLRLGIKLLERVITKIKNDNTAYGIISIEEWSNLRDEIMRIDSTFNEKIQYRRKNYFVYPNRILYFVNNLK